MLPIIMRVKMQITQADLLRLCPNASAYVVAGIVRYAPELLARYRMTEPLEWCHFIAQLAHESGGLRVLEENLNYSADGLRRTFPRYFSDADAAAYARQPERIANRAYANRNGNGDEASGDGWRYRGRGLIQLTGRANYRRVGAAIGVDLEGQPERAAEFPVALQSALVYWADRGLARYALADDAEMVTRGINGGLNGYDHRLELLDGAKMIWPPGNLSGNLAGSRPTLRRGMEGPSVRTLQAALNLPSVMRERDFRLIEDGHFGAQTEAAVKAWQRVAGLLADGVAGDETWATLDGLPRPTEPDTPDDPDHFVDEHKMASGPIQPHHTQPARPGGLFRAATAAFRRLFA